MNKMVHHGKLRDDYPPPLSAKNPIVASGHSASREKRGHYLTIMLSRIVARASNCSLVSDPVLSRISVSVPRNR